jgi:hypothetical protein
MSGKSKRRKSSIPAKITGDEEQNDCLSFDIFEKYDNHNPNVKRVIVGSDGMDIEEYAEDGIVIALNDRHYKYFNYIFERNEKEWRRILTEYDAAEWPHIVSNDAPEPIKDVSLLLRLATRLRKYLKQGNMRACVYVAYHFGIVLQRWEVRWAEPIVNLGKRMQVSGPKARAAKMNKAKSRQNWILEKADPMLGNGKKRETIARDISRDAPPEFKLSPGRIGRILATHRPSGRKKLSDVLRKVSESTE